MLCDSNTCTACGACITICPNNCIDFESDNHGYSYPVIDKSNCVECGLCEKACPVLNPYKKQSVIYPEVYCAKSNNPDIVRNSTSGGVATEITAFFTKKLGSYACGVENGDDNIPHYVLLDSNSDYRTVSGSRYVHSRTDGIFKKVQTCLESGKKVFFCGLPCQVAGLYSYLGKDIDNLFTADIVCHGCTEERIYQDYLKYIENKNNDVIASISHTSKDKGWSILIQRLLKIEFNSGNIMYQWSQQDPYLSLFLDGSMYRPSCYTCKFAHFPRLGDLTLGDFFGIGTIKKIEHLDKNGVSMVMINTKKGQQLFDMVLPCLWAEKRDIEEAVYYNLNLWKPSNKGKSYQVLKNKTDINWDQITKKQYNSVSSLASRTVRRIVKTILGDKNTARLMLFVYKLNGTTKRADSTLNNLQKYVDSHFEKE